mgnify:FL=1
MQEGAELGSRALFPDATPYAIASHWAAVQQRPGGSEWEFWLNWYRRLLEGRPQNWPLLFEIAIQDDAFWQGSDAEINARIAEIVAKHEQPPPTLSDETLAASADQSPHGETLQRNDKQEYIVVPHSVQSDDAFDLAKRRARNAVDDMRIAINRNNYLGVLRDVADNVERELERSADAPVLVFEAVRDAAFELMAILDTDDLVRSDSASQRTVDRFKARFLQSALESRAHDPVVLESFEKLEAFQPPIEPIDPETLQKIGDFVSNNASGVLKDQMPRDAAVVSSPNEPDGKRKSALYRFGSRVVRILILDRLPDNQSVHNMAAAATLIEFFRAHGLVDVITKIVHMFLRY